MPDVNLKQRTQEILDHIKLIEDSLFEVKSQVEILWHKANSKKMGKKKQNEKIR